MTTTTPLRSVFGNVHLGYVVVETQKFDDWRRFGRDAIGMHLDDTLTDFLRFRLDDASCRLLLRRGSAEDVVALGWQVDDDQTFDTVLARVTGPGVPVTLGTAEEAELRGAERLARFPGPNGLTQEIFTPAGRYTTPVDPAARGGFVTGASGMGHVALATKKPHLVRSYYNTVFDARLTDYIDETINGLKFKIRFLRVNERHHSVAIAATNGVKLNPIRTRVQHVNIQVADLYDMTSSYQRVKDLGFRMALDVGQHTNDKELSYYAMTPSGFEWEVGWNPIVVDEKTWEPTTHRGISIWGHTPQGATVIDKLAQFKVAAKSVVRKEEDVPALSGAGIDDR
jgi:2,3-dihydroxybiphenyl 1,2-dioxygenase